MCVQRFDDSRNSAIHTTYRISLRSSSMREPRDPLLKVLTFHVLQFRRKAFKGKSLWLTSRAGSSQGPWRVPGYPQTGRHTFAACAARKQQVG